MVNQRIKKIIFFCVFLLLVGVFVIPQFVFAQASLGIEYGTATGLGTKDLKDTITTIVNILFGFLGIAAVLVILYGGFIWLTSSGETDKIATAKKIIINGVIGLAIILVAFGIVTFVANIMGEATVPGNATCLDGEVRSCGNFGACEREQECGNGQWGTCYFTNPNCDPFGQDIFALTATAPQDGDELPIGNVVVQLTFNNNIANVNLNSGATIKHCDSPSCNNPSAAIPIIGAISFNPKRVDVRPDNSLPEYQCPGWGTTINPAQYPGLACYPYDKNENLNWYQATVITDENLSFRDINGLSIICQAGVPCQFKFKIGELVDLEPPTVNLTEAEDGSLIIYPWTAANINLSDDDIFIFRAEASDDAGLATINFFEQESPLNLGFSQSPNGVTQFTGESGNPWDTSNYEANNSFHIKSQVTDYAANSAESVKQTTLYPAHCYNNVCDEGESCFTDPTKPFNCGEECPACAGSSCSQDPNTCVPNNNACLSNVCVPGGEENECTCYAAPLITGVSPIDGAPGNFVTISGQGFGEEEGIVELVDSNNSVYLARFPSQVNSSCSDTWTNNQVIIALPGAIPQAGYTIRLKAINPYYSTAGPQYLTDVYGDEQGEPTFTVNDVGRPGLCLASPDTGQFNDSFNLYGTGFSGAVQSIEFGMLPNAVIPAIDQIFVSDAAASAKVPNIANNGQTPVLLIVDGEQSNPIAFIIQSAANQDNPYITNFTPLKGPSGQYITIYGGNFGNYVAGQSLVKFNNVPVDFADFPEECSTDFWHDDYIVIKVPAEATGVGDGPITVIRSDGATAVSGSKFDYDNGVPLLPGICSLYPQEGNVNTQVTVTGEYFADSQVSFSGVTLPALPSLGAPGHADIFSVNVPFGAASGEVKVQNISHPNITSEGWPFIVTEEELPSGAGTFDYYEWQFETCLDCLVPQVVEDGNCYGQLASPTPPKYGLSGNTQAYVNAVLGVRFNVDMDNSSFDYEGAGQTYFIQKCNGSGLATSTFNPSACANIAIPPMTTGYPVYSDNSSEYVQTRPIADFDPGYWYRVILTNGLTSQTENFPLENNLNFDSNSDGVNDAYEWHFRTRLDPGLCQPDSVVLEPASKLQPNNPIERGQTVGYTACGQNIGVCAICPDIFQWSWSSSHPQAAQINTAIITSQNQLSANDLVMQPDIAYITSTITHFYNQSTGLYEPLLEPIAGAADLNIVPPSPRVEFNNNCDESQDIFPSPNPYINNSGVCRNIKIQARFVDSVGAVIVMDETTLNSSNIIVSSTSGAVSGDIETWENGFTFSPNSDLAANTVYSVILNNGVLSSEGMSLVGLSGWSFTTGNDNCQDPSAVQLIPPYKLFTSITSPDNTEHYQANLIGDQCQLLMPLPGTGWSWLSEEPSIASVAQNQNAPDTAEVTAQSEGATYIRSTAQIGVAPAITNSGENGKVDVNLTPQAPLTITEHQPQGNNVCVNALVRIDFSEPIRTGQGQMDPSQFANTVTDGAGNSVFGSWQISGNGSRFDFIPNNYLASSTMYSVKIKAGENGIITASGNQYLTSANCWNSGMIYWNADDTCLWGFGTGEEICAIHHIVINDADNPASTTATIAENESTDWLATAYAENNQPLTNPMNYWWISNIDVGVFEPEPVLPGREATTVGQNPFETPVSTDIYALSTTTLGGTEQTESAPATLTVNPVLEGPTVEQTQPQGNNVCLNSLVSVEFDKHLDSNSVSNETFKLQQYSPSPIGNPDGYFTFTENGGYLVSSTSTNELNVGTESFMAEAWIKTADNQGVVFHKFDINGWWFGVGNAAWTLPANTPRVWARLAAPQGVYSPTDKIVWSESQINDGQWHHVVLLVNRTSNIAQIYLDGYANGGPADISQVGSLSNNNNAGIGAQAIGNENFSGAIATVRLYKFGASVPQNIAALIQEQSQNALLINSELANYLAGDWEMEDSQNPGLDSLAGGNNLDLTGAAPVWQQTANNTTACEIVVLARATNKAPLFLDTILTRFINGITKDIFNSLYNFIVKKVYALVPPAGDPGAPPPPSTVPYWWCPVDSAIGDWTLENSALHSTVKYQLNELLPANSLLRVKIMGGNAGVKAINGWPLITAGVAPTNLDNGSYVYSFSTGDNYCALDHVNVSVAADGYNATQWLFYTPEDNPADNDPSAATFDTINNDSDKVYYASGYDINGQEITRVAGVYDWVWSWVAADTSIAAILAASNTQSYAIVGAENQSGETQITASANSLINEINNLTGIAQAAVDLCQNPWPEREPNVVEVPKYIDDDYNFSLRYCRDSGEIGTTDDLPALDENDFVINTTPSSSLTEEDDLLKEYLIPVPTTGDVIGLRIYENSYHLTPLNWYQENIQNPGSPLNKTIDSYPALEDGRTTYVGATNCGLITLTPPAVDSCYTNIYLLSYNQGAEAESAAIINQLIENWEFNVNIEDDELKSKIVSDYQRLTDLIGLAKALENYSSGNVYPGLSSGSFISGMSTSKWPSWNQTLGPALGINMPTDPINTFNACIDCEEPALINGGFEATTTPLLGWTIPYEVGAQINTQYVHEGDQSVGIASASGEGIFSATIDLISNTTYEVSAWVYVEGSHRAQLTFGGNYVNNIGNEWFTPPDYTGWFQLKNRYITPSYSVNPNPTVSIFLLNFQNDGEFFADDVIIQTAGGNCGYDIETCWNPEANGSNGAFSCDEFSYLYSYKSLGPSNYQLSAKMEAVDEWTPSDTLDDHVIEAMSLSNVAVCAVESGSCGDGQVNPPDEECEPNVGMSYNFCPSGVNWWSYVNPPGCNSSCGWIDPLGTATCGNKTTIATCCGGYCGDGVLNTLPAYNITPDEACDASVSSGNDGFANGVSNGSNLTNQYACSPYCQDVGGWCGDGTVQTAYEQCDANGANTALGWSCKQTNNSVMANCLTSGGNACKATCSSGSLYQGFCGDGYVQSPEACDPLNPIAHASCVGCSAKTCDSGWGNCDDNWNNGCEINTASNVQYCGGCQASNNCDQNAGADNGTYTCGNSTCGITCNSGWGNCDGNVSSNGCEASLSTVTNCGSCGNSCEDTEVCFQNQCTAAGGCGNGVIEGTEVCDDGGNNGQFGYCSLNCDGLATLGTPIFLDNFEDWTFSNPAAANWETGYANGVTWSQEWAGGTNFKLKSEVTGSGWNTRDYRVENSAADDLLSADILTQVDFSLSHNFDALILARHNGEDTANEAHYYALWNDEGSYPNSKIRIKRIVNGGMGVSLSETTTLPPIASTVNNSGIYSCVNNCQYWLQFRVYNGSNAGTAGVWLKARWWPVGTAMPTPWNLSYFDSSGQNVGPGKVGLGSWPGTTFYFDNFQVYLLPPFDLTVGQTTPTSAQLSWQSMGPGLNYEWRRKTGSSGIYNLPTPVAAGAVSFTNTGLTPNTDYYYQVRSCKTVGTNSICSTWSDDVLASTPVLQILSFYAQPTAVIPGGSTTLTWNSNATACVLSYPGFSQSFGANGAHTVNNLTSTTVFNLTCSAGGQTVNAGPVTVTVATAPAVPTSFNVINNGQSASSLYLTWQNGINPAPSYNLVEREYKIGLNWVYDDTINISSLPPNGQVNYTDSNLSCGAEYHYQVKSCGAAVCSLYTSWDNASTAGPSITNFYSSTITFNSVTLNWQQIGTPAASGFILQRRNHSPLAWTNCSAPDCVANNLGASPNNTVTGLTPGTAYDFRIKACLNAFSPCSLWASLNNVSTVNVLPPTGLNGVWSGSSPNWVFTGSWSTVSSVSYYQTQIMLKNNNQWTNSWEFSQTVPSLSAIWAQANGQIAGNTNAVKFRVRSCNNANCAEFSDWVISSEYPH